MLQCGVGQGWRTLLGHLCHLCHRSRAKPDTGGGQRALQAMCVPFEAGILPDQVRGSSAADTLCGCNTVAVAQEQHARAVLNPSAAPAAPALSFRSSRRAMNAPVALQLAAANDCGLRGEGGPMDR